NNVGCVLVCDSNDILLGIFSERDYLTKVYNRGIDENTAKISDFMTKDPLTIAPDSPIAFGLSIMAHGGFRHLPITDPDGMAIGIVSVRDMMDYIVSTFMDEVLSLDSNS
ncbi:MAG: CBS domain-containing protein, partial [Bdellovibrionales bacterium]|nr:CBS domain-containing protein [Bdellovibrionales bacterium]